MSPAGPDVNVADCIWVLVAKEDPIFIEELVNVNFWVCFGKIFELHPSLFEIIILCMQQTSATSWICEDAKFDWTEMLVEASIHILCGRRFVGVKIRRWGLIWLTFIMTLCLTYLLLWFELCLSFAWKKWVHSSFTVGRISRANSR